MSNTSINTNVRYLGQMCDAFYQDSRVHVYDYCLRRYTTAHRLTAKQIAGVQARADRSAA